MAAAMPEKPITWNRPTPSAMLATTEIRAKRIGALVSRRAKKAGVSYVTISRIENDRMSPTVDMLEKLAKALDISVRDLFPVERRRHPKEDNP